MSSISSVVGAGALERETFLSASKMEKFSHEHLAALIKQSIQDITKSVSQMKNKCLCMTEGNVGAVYRGKLLSKIIQELSEENHAQMRQIIEQPGAKISQYYVSIIIQMKEIEGRANICESIHLANADPDAGIERTSRRLGSILLWSI